MIVADGIGVLRGGRAILDGVSLRAEAGRVLAVLGPNGAGKSTLLRVLAGEMAPEAGRVVLAGVAAGSWRGVALARMRAVLPQAASLAFPLAAAEVAALGRIPHAGTAEMRRDGEAVADALSRAGVSHLARRNYATLSGGEQARVQLARVLAQADGPEARALFLDEPTASLDLPHQHAVLAEARTQAARGLAVIAVLHDINLAFRYADDALLLAGGRTVACGRVEEVLTEAALARAYGMLVRVTENPARPGERIALAA